MFSLSYQYAKRWADQIFILSAKYGLVGENQWLEPYNQTLKDMSRQQQKEWAMQVLHALGCVSSTTKDEFVLLAGNTYCRDVIGHLVHYKLPLEGLRMGKRMAFLKEKLKEASSRKSDEPAGSALEPPEKFTPMCAQIHTLFNSLPRYNWEQISDIPFQNGIYIVFENGERYHGMSRIVRVGTHRSEGRLKQRMKDHFIRENHDGSIFRKNIGKAILNAHHDPYLSIWTLDTSKPENARYLDPQKNADTEHRVSEYLRKAITFTAFPVEKREQRMRLEEAIISTLNHTNDFRSSDQWTGKYSPEIEIRNSGLWLKQGLDAQPLTQEEFKMIQLFSDAAGHSDTDNPPTIVMENFKKETTSSLGKYAPLYEYLHVKDDSHIALSFGEIETILGFALPKSAYTYPMWWTPGGSHTQCQSWISAGYRAVNIVQGIRVKCMLFKKS